MESAFLFIISLKIVRKTTEMESSPMMKTSVVITANLIIIVRRLRIKIYVSKVLLFLTKLIISWYIKRPMRYSLAGSVLKEKCFTNRPVLILVLITWVYRLKHSKLLELVWPLIENTSVFLNNEIVMFWFLPII